MKTINLIQAIPDIPVKKRVAAYARVSLDTERMNHSLSAQISFYSSFIQRNPTWQYAGVYSDDGISGTSTARHGFQALITECRKKNIDIILTKSISRFARNTLDLLNIVRELKTLDIEVRFEKENINTLSADGELMLTLLASFAQEESHSISQNTKWAIKKKFEKGIECGAPLLFGYSKDQSGYRIKEDEAKIVKEIFNDYLEGLSPHKIADKYHIPYTTIWQMIRQTKYMGDIILQKTLSCFEETHKSYTRKRNKGELPKYYVSDALPAIIDKEIFKRVQDRIKNKLIDDRIYKRGPFTSIIICSKCGRTYRRRAGGNGSKHYWKCGGKTEHNGCTSNNIDEIKLYKICEKYKDKINKIITNGIILKIEFKGGGYEQCNIDTCNT